MHTPLMIAQDVAATAAAAQADSLATYVVMAAIFGAVTIGSWLVMNRFDGGDSAPAEDRLDRLKNPRAAAAASVTDKKTLSKNEALAAALEKAGNRIESKVQGTEEELGKLREKLINAGFRRETAPLIFKMIQLISTAVGLMLGGVMGLLLDGLSQGLIIKLALGMIGGFGIPTMMLGMMAKKRMEKIFLGLPDALDLMVVCVEAGLGIDQALRKVADEMSKSHKDIGEEFTIANQQLQLGRPRAEVLTALGYRSGVDDLKQLASILIQADKFGSSIGKALRVQSDAMRTKRRQIAEEKAAKTAVKMIFPMVLFIFPGIFVVLVGPAAISMYRQLLSE